jgi:hypothetical protein
MIMSGRSHQKLLEEWAALLREARNHEAEIASLSAAREELEQLYSRAVSTRSMRETLQITARDTTRRLGEVLLSAVHAAGNLRRAVKSRRQNQ